MAKATAETTKPSEKILEKRNSISPVWQFFGVTESDPQVPRSFLVTVQTENGKVEVEEFGETVLSCKYQVEKDPNPRVEWKKIRNRDVSFVYYEGKIVGGFQGRAVMEGASIRIKKAMLLDSGEYRCEVSARQDSRPLGEATVSLTVLVPPDVPSCGIPSSVLTGTVVELTCRDRQGTPPSLYRWYKNGIALPNTPAQDPLFANSSYTLNSSSGTLQFNTVSKGDAGQYQCEASNGVGEPQRCTAKFMQIDDMNVSGIVAAVVVVSLVVSMCGLGVVFAHRHGYFNKEHGRNGSSEYCTTPQDYSQDFKHTQSFML
ncbi:junctional adhesion molecule B-like isoform X1 [Acipenser ruthenus]|uniref:junctional adhesion molecule B-like isoform X1 n=1 Tax=Acipenser ruthenus TaxID=7906 RepID=UPI0027417E01|nr:junctional adhesion molecule B-like isoform X1 [Acipenser ruthenus]